MPPSPRQFPPVRAGRESSIHSVNSGVPVGFDSADRSRHDLDSIVTRTRLHRETQYLDHGLEATAAGQLREGKYHSLAGLLGRPDVGHRFLSHVYA